MNEEKRFRTCSRARVLIAIAFFCMVLALGFQTRKPGGLELTVINGAGGQPTPARIELLDGAGVSWVADDALPVGGDCVARPEPLQIPLERAIGLLSKTMKNPYTNTTQFYSIGNSQWASLPAGSYKVRVFKGIEFNVEERALQIRAGETFKLVVQLSRWIDLSKQGWYSADDHLHIARPVNGLNAFLSKWMQAEDLHVANLLQWGNSSGFHNTLQYAFGKPGSYRERDYLLAAGQENPRTNLLGHTIILGANSPINFPSAYVIYRSYWEEAKRQGALSGYAHFGTRCSFCSSLADGSSYGLAIDLPTGHLSFLEILQRGTEEWWAWYEILNTGFRITPTAGTDYPCLPSYPGRERFYTKVEGPLTYDTWLEGIRRGRTFVTNGPALDFDIGGQEMGGELVLERPGATRIEGRARFDPKRERVDRLELVENGQVVGSFPRLNNSAEISFHIPYQVHESSWLAIRARGQKLDEPGIHPSLAHSAPIYVTVKNTPPLSARPLAKIMARVFLARLQDLQARLAEDQLQYLAAAEAHNDGVDEADLRKQRAGLLRNIESARLSFSKLTH